MSPPVVHVPSTCEGNSLCASSKSAGSSPWTRSPAGETPSIRPGWTERCRDALVENLLWDTLFTSEDLGTGASNAVLFETSLFARLTPLGPSSSAHTSILYIIREN